MSAKDIFDKPFDEGTLVKLEIFEKYFEEWLPPFIMGNFNKPIQVFDLFAGSGYDKNGVAGSPIRILEIINKHRRNIVHKNKKVILILNDADNNKTEQLKKNVGEKVKELSLKSMVEIKFSSNKFIDCLSEHKIELKRGCNLIFIDQNGFKEVTEEVFQFLINLDTTEFMFFISSTFMHRFAKQKEVHKYHPKFDFDKIKETSRKKIHNVICEEFEKYIPPNIKRYGLIPFSIMKKDQNNVYGLIFVSKHILGADKFLHTVWKKNPINGNANFDIEADLQKKQLHLFDGRIPTKIENFQIELRQLIINGTINNNSNAYFFALNKGCISQLADEVIRQMKKEKIIVYESPSPLVNYEQVIKNKRTLTYELLKK